MHVYNYTVEHLSKDTPEMRTPLYPFFPKNSSSILSLIWALSSVTLVSRLEGFLHVSMCMLFSLLTRHPYFWVGGRFYALFQWLIRSPRGLGSHLYNNSTFSDGEKRKEMGRKKLHHIQVLRPFIHIQWNLVNMGPSKNVHNY